MLKLAAFIADVLTRDAAVLGARWQARAPAVAPRAAERAPLVDPAQAERLVHAVASALRADPRCHDALLRAGWMVGTSAHHAGTSLHYLLKELDLLLAMLLYACECVLREEPAAWEGAAGRGAAEGMEVARRVQRACSLLTLAASKGFTHVYRAELQERYRTLRHDLRNPLGTIKSAVALMEDESVPPELRNNPRFRAMVLRNALSLDAVIARELGDAVTLDPAQARQEVSLRDVALAVRRDLREEAAAIGCEVIVDDALPTLRVDSAGLELALRSAVILALRVASAESTVTIALGGLREGSATLAVTYDGAGRLQELPPAGTLDVTGVLEFADELLGATGGRVWRDDAGVRLEVPTSALHPVHDVAGVS